jgi:ribonuclease HI
MSDEQTQKRQGIVLYCDGGARPSNPGFGGYGIHGYKYIAEPKAIKGLGLGNVYTTSKGYQFKEDIKIFKAEEQSQYNDAFDKDQIVSVTPTSYIDFFGSSGSPVSNNVSELVAMIKGLEHIRHEFSIGNIIDQAYVYSDSDLTVKGANERMYKWEANGWCKSDGLPVANTELWIKLKAIKDEVSGLVRNLVIKWIKGHAEKVAICSQGNTCADELATIGVYQSMFARQPDQHRFHFNDVDAYWKTEAEKHPFLNMKKCYFNTLAESNFPGTYYMSDHDDENDDDGKRISDIGFAVVMLDQVDPVIEKIKEQQTLYTKGADTLCSIRLSNLYKPNILRNYLRFGDAVFIPPSEYSANIRYIDSTLITKEYKPALLARRSVHELSELNNILEAYKSGKTSVVATDVTNLFYDVSVKEVKQKKKDKKSEEVAAQPEVQEVVYKLKDDIPVGISFILASFKNPFDQEKEPIDARLSFGIDIPERNTFKRLETLKPEVTIVSWITGDNSYRFATIIKAGNNIGIWAAPYSNIRILK